MEDFTTDSNESVVLPTEQFVKIHHANANITSRAIEILKYNGFVHEDTYWVAPYCLRNKELVNAIQSNDNLDSFMGIGLFRFYKAKDLENKVREIKAKVKNGTITDFDYASCIRFIEDNELREQTKSKNETPHVESSDETEVLSKSVDINGESTTVQNDLFSNLFGVDAPIVTPQEHKKRHRRTKAELIACGYYDKKGEDI